jgi:hypothetical protein
VIDGVLEKTKTMRDNFETILVGQKVVLVPYRKEHVFKYHEWMQSCELLEATASEPLTIEEEYGMQKSWRDDQEKCTFIVLQKDKCQGLPSPLSDIDGKKSHEASPSVDEEGVSTASTQRKSQALTNRGQRTLPGDFIRSNLHAMIGDVNLFLSIQESDNEEESQEATLEGVKEPGEERSVDKEKMQQAELDIMIAEPEARRMGMGAEACRIMMLYSWETLNIKRFFVKIGEDNKASKNMFEAALNFQQCNYVQCFREYELEYIVKEQFDGKYLQQTIGDIERLHCVATDL